MMVRSPRSCTAWCSQNDRMSERPIPGQANNRRYCQSAILQTKTAQRSELEGSGVFFVPPYEIEWYRALVEAGRAEIATTPEEKAAAWEIAGHFYELFARRAGPKEKAASLAQARAKLCAKLSARFKSQVKKAPPPPRS